jgi:hypothetical protein
MACNASEPWRIVILPPSGEWSPMPSDEERLVALRVVPNYEPPFAPLVFQVGSQVMEVSFTAVNRTLAQTAALQGAAHETTAIDIGSTADEADYPVTCRLVLVLRHILSRLQAPTCFRELVHHAQALVGVPQRLDSLAQLNAARNQVLDMAWIHAIKWARLRFSDRDQKQQLASARELHGKVREAHERDHDATERTLRNMTLDYAECMNLKDMKPV